MHIEKWHEIKNTIKDQFDVEDEGREDIEDVPRGSVEYVIFAGPLGKMMLEYTYKPVIVDKRTIGSKRIGSETAVEYTYSDTEMAGVFKAFRWDEGVGEWVEMEIEKMKGFVA